MESKNKNKGFPYNLATALDCAIRDFEEKTIYIITI